METGEKKLKQSILCIALLLLLCGYFSAQQATDNSLSDGNGQHKNSDGKTEIFNPGIESNVIQCETFYDDIEYNEIAGS
jgi:formate/nitrite transporter FocA (FNT family)